MSTIKKYLSSLDTAGYFVLIDPDRKNAGLLDDLVSAVNESGADGILVGGSLFMDGKFHSRISRIKELSNVPVILFPGSATQLNSHCDAVLFMSVISGRNANHLIGEQVVAAPIVKDLGIESIPTGYMLFDGGGNSTVEFMSNSKPLPMERADLAVAHGLAAQYLGMQLLYLEAGSGAKLPVPDETISAMKSEVELPLIVGGGITTPDVAGQKVIAGADFIVTGTVMEESVDVKLLTKFAEAVHQSK